MKDTKLYFETHAHHHIYHRNIKFYIPIIESLPQKEKNQKLTVLDVGCGDGSFIRDMVDGEIRADYIGIDMSFSMIEMSKDKLRDESIPLLVADGFGLPLRSDMKFDIIHLDSVIHHLIEKTRSKSSLLAKQLLKNLIDRLNPKGILIIEEMYYDSYLIPELTSAAIFYGLKFLKFLKFDMSGIHTLIQPGLEVNFFSTRQLQNVLSGYGHIEAVKRSSAYISLYKRLLLLKDYGHVSYIVHCSNNS